MMKKKILKFLAITMASVIVLGGLLLLGLYGLASQISKQRNCEWANIDNIEIHAHIDIPEVKNSDCEYLEEENIKTTCFDIEVDKMDINRYIQLNSLKKLRLSTAVKFDEQLKSKSNLYEFNDSSELYYRIGSHEGKSWQILLNNTTGRLCVFLKYKD